MKLLRSLLEAELKQIELLDLENGADHEVIKAALDHHKAEVTFGGERALSWMTFNIVSYARKEIEKGKQVEELRGHGFHPYKALYKFSDARYSPAQKACFFELDVRYVMQDKGHNNSAAYGAFKLKATAPDDLSEVRSIKHLPDDIEFAHIWPLQFFSGELQL